MTAKHWSANNVFWTVVAGRMRPVGCQLDNHGLEVGNRSTEICAYNAQQLDQQSCIQNV